MLSSGGEYENAWDTQNMPTFSDFRPVRDSAALKICERTLAWSVRFEREIGDIWRWFWDVMDGNRAFRARE